MQLKHLGKNGPQVSALGLGSHTTSPSTSQDDQELLATIHTALDAGMSFLNTADFYGSGHHGMLIGRAIRERRDEVFLSVKFGMMLSPSGGFLGLDGRPAAVKNFTPFYDDLEQELRSVETLKGYVFEKIAFGHGDYIPHGARAAFLRRWGEMTAP